MKTVLYNKETTGFDPYSVEFKKNLDMSQEREERIHNNYKTYSQSNELLSTAWSSSQMLSQLILMTNEKLISYLMIMR